MLERHVSLRSFLLGLAGIRSRQKRVKHYLCYSKPILDSRADDAIHFADSEELVRNSGRPSALIEVGTDHRLAEPEPLEAMLRACEG